MPGLPDVLVDQNSRSTKLTSRPGPAVKISNDLLEVIKHLHLKPNCPVVKENNQSSSLSLHAEA